MKGAKVTRLQIYLMANITHLLFNQAAKIQKNAERIRKNMEKCCKNENIIYLKMYLYRNILLILHPYGGKKEVTIHNESNFGNRA